MRNIITSLPQSFSRQLPHSRRPEEMIQLLNVVAALWPKSLRFVIWTSRFPKSQRATSTQCLNVNCANTSAPPGKVSLVTTVSSITMSEHSPKGRNNVFKCALCPYTNPIRKGLAAHYQKRHWHRCLLHSLLGSIQDGGGEKRNKVMVPLASEAESPAMSEELRLAVDRRKCSLCSFQAFSRKSIVSHYIKRHPGVFPQEAALQQTGSLLHCDLFQGGRETSIHGGG